MKKPSNKTLIIIVITLIIINLATLSFIWFNKPAERRWGHHSGGPHVEQYLQKELGLDEEQLQAFKEMRKKHFQSTRGLTGQMHKTRKQLAKLLSSEYDTIQVEALITTLASTQAALEKHNFLHLRGLRKICNESQKPKFDSVMLKMVNRAKRFRQKRMKRHE